MLQIISALVLGIVEGLTEFLPVSSTGHLILFNRWFSFGGPQAVGSVESFTFLFDIVIQSGAILAVIILFWKDLWPHGWSFKKLEEQWGKIFVAFIITAVIGLLFNDLVEAYLLTPLVIAAALIVYGIIFLLVESYHKTGEGLQITYRDAALIGLAQSLALVPGTSRSGATIIVMLLLGYARPVAAKFSFLLAVPTLLAASGYKLLKYHNPISTAEWSYLAIGFLAAFVSAYLISRWFMSFISKHDFKPFAWYRLALGFIIILGMFFS